MTPQEKLAARLELVAKRLDPDGPSVRDTPGLNSFAEITAEVRAIATALSEQGEVTTTTDASGRCVAVTRQDGEGRILSVIWEASEHGGSQAVAWMTDEPSVCGNKITTESQVADGWRANGWNVWPLGKVSEHGGGGEAVSAESRLAEVGVFKGHHGLRGLAEADAFWDQQPYGTRLYYGDGGLDYLHRDVLRAAVKALDTPPTPSAPVVDDAWKNAVLNALAGTGMDAPHDEPPHSILNRIIRWHEEAATDPAISGVSAPVEVARLVGLMREVVPALKATGVNVTLAADVEKAAAALTPPAAAPRVERKVGCEGSDGLLRVHKESEACDVCSPAASEDTPSRSRLRRIAAEKGETAPRFDGASEDGLPNPENGDFDCPKAAAMRVCPCGFCAAIRRLAASGQGVEGWTIQVKRGGPNDELGIWAVEPDGSSIWLAPTQEKGNG